jgi:hypothetical protein
MQNEEGFAGLTWEQLGQVADVAHDLRYGDTYCDLEPVRTLYDRTFELVSGGFAHYQCLLESEHTGKVIEGLAELQGEPPDNDVLELLIRVFRRVNLDIGSLISMPDDDFKAKVSKAVASRYKGSSFRDVSEDPSNKDAIANSEVGTLPGSTVSEEDTAASIAASASTAGCLTF